MKNSTLLTLIVLIFLGGFLIFSGGDKTTDTVKDEQLSGQGEAQIGGAFTLTDHTGKTVHDSDYRGKLMLVFFGFTHCPDICPITTATLSHTMDALGADADKVAALFITVDPTRDTPAVLKEYLSNFNPHMVGLTGTPEQVKAVVDAYKAYAAKSESVNEGAVPEDADSDRGHMADEDHGDHDEDDDHHHDDSNYSIDHSGFIYLMDKNGKYLHHFPYSVSEKELTEAVREYLK